jgi:hypothetical protein
MDLRRDDPGMVTVVEAAATMAFRLTAHQRRRFRIGLGGVALIVWSMGVVRLAVTHRMTAAAGLVPLVVLTVALAVVVAILARMQPIVVLTDDALHLRWGPRRAEIGWGEVDDVVIRERGVGRRVVVHAAGRRRVLPVPFTGGSILSPGADPDLDHKVELIRGWWLERRSP